MADIGQERAWMQSMVASHREHQAVEDARRRAELDAELRQWQEEELLVAAGLFERVYPPGPVADVAIG